MARIPFDGCNQRYRGALEGTPIRSVATERRGACDAYVFSAFLRSHPVLTPAPSEPSLFCSLYSISSFEKLKLQLSIGRSPPPWPLWVYEETSRSVKVHVM